MPIQDDKFLFPGTPEERSKNVDEYVDNIFDAITLPTASSSPAEIVEILVEAQREIEAKKELNAKAVKIVEDLKAAEAVSEESLPEIEVLEEGTEEYPLELEEVSEAVETKISPAKERYRLICQNNPELCQDKEFIGKIEDAIKNRPTEAEYLIEQYEQEALAKWRETAKDEDREIPTEERPDLSIESEKQTATEKLGEAMKRINSDLNIISANLSKDPTFTDPPEIVRWQKGYRPDVMTAFKTFKDLIIKSPNPVYTHGLLVKDKRFTIVPQAEKDVVLELLAKYKINELIEQSLQGK